jgi:hypothetical protein
MRMLQVRSDESCKALQRVERAPLDHVTASVEAKEPLMTARTNRHDELVDYP